MGVTYEDAIKIAAAINTADGGCSDCVGNLYDKMFRAFPSVDWVAAGWEALQADECGPYYWADTLEDFREFLGDL